jgi:hypothetical protein
MSESFKAVLERYVADPDLLDRDSQRDIALHEADLKHQMFEHASVYLKWSRLSVMAASQLKSLQHHVEKVLWLEAKAEARQLLTAAGEKPTEGRLDEIASANTQYRNHVAMLMRASSISETLKNVVFAFMHRRDMIQNINITQNSELKNLHGLSSSRDGDFGALQSIARDVITKSREE